MLWTVTVMVVCINIFRWRAICLFNSLPKSIRNILNCSFCSFKQRLVNYLDNIPSRIQQQLLTADAA